jgi:imidazole glycerol-phosphate synthase subunit HisH
MTVAIIDCGGANLRSVQNAVELRNMDTIITKDKNEVTSASFVILPGVGSAKSVMARLGIDNLRDAVISHKKPVLGICVGMQVLFESSEEHDTSCLGVISGNIKKFNSECDLKVPQMGWNKVTFLQDNAKNLDDYYYFANSYYSQIYNHTLATAEYGLTYAAAVQKENYLGCQFHPEKSSAAGEKFLDYFFKM